MKTHLRPTVALAMGLGLWAALAPSAAARQVTTAVERPRHDENTRRAQRALEHSDSAAEHAAARPFYQQALVAAQAAIASDSNNPLAHYQAGVAALGLERFGESARHLDRAARLWPIYALETAAIRERTWAALYQEAVPLVSAARYREAIPFLERADTIYNERPEVMIMLGRIHAQLGEHDKALQRLDRALSIIHSERAGEVDTATTAEWQREARSIPQLKATILLATGRFEESADLLRDLVAQNPDDVTLSRNLGTVLIQIGEHEEAFQVFDTLMARPGLTGNDYYSIGLGYYQGAATDRAIRAFREAAQRSIRDRDALEMWARSLQLDSVWREIPPVAERWLELDPYSEQAHTLLTHAVRRMGDHDRAREVMSRSDRLEVQVGGLQISRSPAGGAVVRGHVTNKRLEPGTAITVTFTFYDSGGRGIGTGDYHVKLGGRGTIALFRVQFQSHQTVAGYGYRITIG